MRVGQENFIEISLTILQKFNKPLMFDIYVKRTEKDYTKIFKEGDQIDWERVHSYEGKGIQYFYVLTMDYEKYTMFVELLGKDLAKNSAGMDKEEAATILKEMVNYTMHEIIVNKKMNARIVSNAGNVVTSCVTNLKNEPQALPKILSIMSRQDYIVKHSIAVSIFSIILGKASGIESESNLAMLGLGGFLHDIGLSQITFNPEEKEILSPEERKEMSRHPELGKRLLDPIKSIRSEVLDIVLQHHEQPNGHGYPNGLREGAIYHMAKIVAIADTFASLITKRSYRSAMTVKEALETMHSDVGKFDKPLLRVFEKIVKP